jgi:hypothetical protein
MQEILKPCWFYREKVVNKFHKKYQFEVLIRQIISIYNLANYITFILSEQLFNLAKELLTDSNVTKRKMSSHIINDNTPGPTEKCPAAKFGSAKTILKKERKQHKRRWMSQAENNY